MTKQKSTKRALLLSALSLLMCVSMLIGSTFAWFTDSVTSGSNKIVAGTLKLDLELLEKNADGTTEWNSIKESKAPIFNYNLWEPGYTDVKILKVENEGTLALKWIAKFVSASELSILADVIDVYVKPSANELTYPADRNLEGYKKVGTVADFVDTIEETTYGNLAAGEVAYLGIALKMQESAGNDYQGLSLGTFDIQILATQDTVESDSFDDQYDVNAEYPSFTDKWDGTIDTAWYNDSSNEFVLASAEEFAGFANLVNGGNTFAGKTIRLANNFDLTNKEWTPIGGYDASKVFSGTFDGQGHTISNMTITKTDNASAKLRLALFSNITNATIQNLTVKDSTITAQSSNARASVLVMTANTSNTIENITVDGAAVVATSGDTAYTAGIVGWTEKIALKNISVSNIKLNATATSKARASSVVGQHSQADGAATILDNFTISNVEIEAKAADTFVGGAFAFCEEGNVTISNGSINGLTITSTAQDEGDIGGLIGCVEVVDPLKVDNVTVTELDIDFSGKNSKVGGIAGWERSVSRENGGYSNVTVSGTINENITTGSGSEVGGFVGISFYYPKTYVDCSADVDVVTGGTAGGFVGTSCTNGWANQTDAYTSCIARGDVAADVAGGFAGKAWLTNNTTMAMTKVECYGAVTSKYHAGGMIGYAGKANNNIVIKDSVASQNVIGTVSSTTVGDIIGAGDAKVTVE